MTPKAKVEAQRRIKVATEQLSEMSAVQRSEVTAERLAERGRLDV